MEKLQNHHLLNNQNRGAASALLIVALGIALVTEMRPRPCVLNLAGIGERAGPRDTVLISNEINQATAACAPAGPLRTRRLFGSANTSIVNDAWTILWYATYRRLEDTCQHTARSVRLNSGLMALRSSRWLGRNSDRQLSHVKITGPRSTENRIAKYYLFQACTPSAPNLELNLGQNVVARSLEGPLMTR